MNTQTIDRLALLKNSIDIAARAASDPYVARLQGYGETTEGEQLKALQGHGYLPEGWFYSGFSVPVNVQGEVGGAESTIKIAYGENLEPVVYILVPDAD